MGNSSPPESKKHRPRRHGMLEGQLLTIRRNLARANLSADLAISLHGQFDIRLRVIKLIDVHQHIARGES
jgi:hypothetical protein